MGPLILKQGHFVDLLPILVLVLVTSLVLLNAKAALRFNSILVILKFSALALFVFSRNLAYQT